MKAERWRRVETLFAAAQSLDEAKVDTYLREQCGGDETLEQEVASLLRHHRSDASALAPEHAPWQRLLQDLAGPASVAPETIVSAEEKVGDDIGPYRLLRLLGRGGMGSVWYAERRDRLVSRGVALKLPLGYGAQLASRFAREREIVAKLAHPNIARLYDAGISASGQAYLALEYIEGKSLCDYCDEHKLTLRARLDLFLQVLSAVQYAHSRLVVHRDLKPTNILVTPEGQVHLLDFGVAKMLGDTTGADAELTRGGVAAMTLAYASPEQIAGQSVSTAADIYSLGVILFELLVGARPYRVKHSGRGALEEAILLADIRLPSAASMTEAIAAARASTVRDLRKELRGDLDAITLMALQNQPEQRYATVAAFADDLARHRDGHAVLAHRPSRWYRWRKFAWRNRVAVIGVSVASAALVGLTGIALWQARVAANQEARTAIVRDFMFDLIDDAEPDELRPNAQVTGKEMLDGAVARAHRHFSDQPALQGELLSELGRMYVRLGEINSAKPLFAEALTLLERNASSDDAALNKTRARWAQVLLDENDIDRARAFANLALESCTRRTTDCAKARAYADNLLSRIALLGGNVEQSLVAMRRAVDETARGFGATDQESAMALLNLALMARNAGYIREEESAMSRALAISEGQTLRAADRVQLHRSAAIIDLDLGRYESAQRRLSDLLSTTTARTERALQLRLLANALLARGDPVAARQASESAIALADGNKPSAEVFNARQVRAQSLALLGQSEESVAEIQTVIQGLRELGRSDESPVAIRARRIRGEILLRVGDAEDAYKELVSLSTKLMDASEGHALELGQTLDLLGCALRELNRPKEAVAAHDRARIHLERQLPADHPFLNRNALYRDAAANDRERFKQQAARTKLSLAPDSIWRTLIDAQWDPSVCVKSGLRTCVLVL